MKARKLLAGIMSAAMTMSLLSAMPSFNASADVLVENDFEANYDGWYNIGDFTEVTAVSAAAHDSTRGMAVTGRLSTSDGAQSQKGLYIEGGIRYDYSVFVKADTVEHFKLTLTWKNSDGSEGSDVIAETDADAGAWTALTAAYKAPDGAYDLTLTITTDSTNDFFFDDVKVTGRNRVYSKAEIEAYAADAGLKDIYANHFRVGTCMPNGSLNNSVITGIVLKEFNSVTCENELKPDATLVQNGSTDDNIKVSLSSAAGIIDFCIRNNIAMRGHTFVWHSQTPSWFFKQNFSGSWTDKATMNKRMESYIHNMFDAIEQQYPDLNLYAYDVCNECIADGQSGGPRQAGDNNQNQGTSAWVSVYGDNSFVKQAFTYAKKYRPDGCKLFYNDYNEYETAKMNGIMNLLKDLKANDLIDGMGMQSHITPQYTSVSQYVSALNNYADLLGCVHITELDIAGADANFYGGVMQGALDNPAVEAFVVWGTTDNTSWRSSNSPLLFDGSGNKKEAYNKLASLVPESDWGDGNNPVGGGKEIKPIEADADGCYFRHTYENGEDGWSGRGAASASQSSKESYQGSNSLAVSGRTATWNGASYALRSNPFTPGGTFSFGAMVKFTDGEATEDIKMTLQYSAGGEDHYDQVALVTAKKGEWTFIGNDSYTIPEDASSMLLYLETPDDGESLIDFYIDEAYGGVKGADPLSAAQVTTESTTATTTTTTTTTTATSTTTTTGSSEEDPQLKPTVMGDVNCDSKVDVKDAVLLARLVGQDTDEVTETGMLNADVDHSGKVDMDDIPVLLKFIANLIPSL